MTIVRSAQIQCMSALARDLARSGSRVVERDMKVLPVSLPTIAQFDDQNG